MYKRQFLSGGAEDDAESDAACAGRAGARENEEYDAARAKDLGAKLIALAFSSNGAFSRNSQDFFKRVFHHAKLRGLSHMGISFPKADTSWTSKFFSTYWRQRLVCCLCGTSAHLVLKTLAGDALYNASLKTGAQGAKAFMQSYGREG